MQIFFTYVIFKLSDLKLLFYNFKFQSFIIITSSSLDLNLILATYNFYMNPSLFLYYL